MFILPFIRIFISLARNLNLVGPKSSAVIYAIFLLY